jgi:hypothetical protein
VWLDAAYDPAACFRSNAVCSPLTSATLCVWLEGVKVAGLPVISTHATDDADDAPILNSLHVVRSLANFHILPSLNVSTSIPASRRGDGIASLSVVSATLR